MLSVGIIGLPNVGKSTLFNALTSGRAEVSNYPFTTIEPNVGMVPVADPRLAELERLLAPAKTTPCCIRFIDIAGLVRGASEGNGLGNQFLGEIRQVDAVAHVLRFFTEAEVAHVFADVDPVRDAEVVETELLLADLEILERAMERRDREWRTYPREHAAERDRFMLYRQTLEQGVALRTLDLDPRVRSELKAVGMLSGKPMLYVANTDEGAESGSGAWRDRLEAISPAAQVVDISARLEAELSELEPDERTEFMAELGLAESGLDRVVRTSFGLLGLISFFTIVKNKLQAWEIPAGTTAPAAAGKVHSDMERGFIRAQVVSSADLCAAGSWQELQRQGRMRTVGREHEIEDGDVVEFLFNV